MIRNQELARKILEILEILLEACVEAKWYLQEEEYKKFQEIGRSSLEGLRAIQKAAQTEKEEVYQILVIRCENCYFSMESLLLYKENSTEIKLNKLEFEYYPLLRIIYARFYYFAFVEGNIRQEQYFWEHEAVELLKNPYIENKNYNYDISVCILAYNKLECTKLCVEAVLKFLPRQLRCELILVNHGSTDEVKEYFETIFPEKQVDIKINLADGIAYVLPALIAEGEYILVISNDVIISKNAISVMYSAMKKDKKIAYAVPSTPNIANYQSIFFEKQIYYESDDIFQKLASKHNKENKRKEEVRVRLLNPIFMCRTEYWTNSNITKAFSKSLLRKTTIMFWDDELSVLFRRAGYKNVLMKDVICHHFGAVTSKDQVYDFLEGRQQFFRRYGVDPYEKGGWWSYELFQKLKCKKADAKQILGINTGLGSDPLKIKEKLKEETGNMDVKLILYTMEERFLIDLKAISDKAEYVADWDELFAHLKGKFDYIMFGGVDVSEELFKKICQHLFQFLERHGTFILQTTREEQADWFEKQYKNVIRVKISIPKCCSKENILYYFAFCEM